MKAITQKKKGIAGLFGKKETVQVPYITNEIQDFNKRLTSARDLRNNQMEIYVDSLRLQNRLLNHKLYDFVSSLDNQIQQSFTEQYLEITETRWNFPTVCSSDKYCCRSVYYFFFHYSIRFT